MNHQQQQFPPQKATPARRRGKRPVNSPARRTYASENDMGSEPLFPIELQGPFTPQKSAANSPAPASQLNNTKSKPRNGGNGGNKMRAKQVSSPGPARPGRTTPPPTTNKPIAAAAFAGATFHASPAPSSLPIPSFLAKTLDSPSVRDPNTGREPSPPATDSEAAPTPQHRPPLADAAPKSRPSISSSEPTGLRKSGHAELARPTFWRRTLPLSRLPTQVRPPQEPSTLPPNLFGVNSRRPGFQRNSSGGIPASELDGTPGRPIGPAISRPFQDRIRAARSVQKQAEPVQNTEAPQQNPGTDELTDRLKRFLAISGPQNGQPAPQGPAPPHGFRDAPRPFPLTSGHLDPTASISTTSAAPSMPFPPSGAPQPYPAMPNSGMSTMPPTSTAPTTNSSNNRSADILHMEDSLRRVLKLTPAAPAAPPANYPPSHPQNYPSNYQQNHSPHPRQNYPPNFQHNYPPNYPRNYPPNYPPNYQSS